MRPLEKLVNASVRGADGSSSHSAMPSTSPESSA
jgi:hypothetical protein